MVGALVILAALIVIGVVLYAVDVLYYRPKEKTAVLKAAEETAPSEEAAKTDNAPEEEAECCGMHQVCEKTNLSPHTGEIVYYDDEELDRYRGRDAEDYTVEEIEEFRDVLLTLLPQDVAGWSRSIQVRGITLPTEIRDELLLIVGDLRH
ncbi:MAG: phospholipase [Muribaculaceae bacterium]|nr:phospholipase [Muribaculaceae bacterium]